MPAVQDPRSVDALASVLVGRRVIVAEPVRVAPRVRRRLAELGVRPGSPVSVLRRTSGGGAILKVGDGRVAVSRSILGAVLVRPDDVAPVAGP